MPIGKKPIRKKTVRKKARFLGFRNKGWCPKRNGFFHLTWEKEDEGKTWKKKKCLICGEVHEIPLSWRPKRPKRGTPYYIGPPKRRRKSISRRKSLKRPS